MFKRYFYTMKEQILANSERIKSVLNLTAIVLSLVFLPFIIATFWIQWSIAINIICLVLGVLLMLVNLVHGLLKRKDGQCAVSEFVLAGLWALGVIARIDMLIGLLIIVAV